MRDARCATFRLVGTAVHIGGSKRSRIESVGWTERLPDRVQAESGQPQAVILGASGSHPECGGGGLGQIFYGGSGPGGVFCRTEGSAMSRLMAMTEMSDHRRDDS